MHLYISFDLLVQINNVIMLMMKIVLQILQKVLFEQLSTFLTMTGCSGVFRSGCRAHHRAETALIKVFNVYMLHLTPIIMINMNYQNCADDTALG